MLAFTSPTTSPIEDVAPVAQAPIIAQEETKLKDDAEYVKDETLREIAKVAKDDKMLYNNMAMLSHCESKFYNIQSQVVKYGKREESYGVAQIHLPSHPHITKEEALDVKFSVQFMADEIRKGNIWKWYGFNPQTKTCTNGIIIPSDLGR